MNRREFLDLHLVPVDFWKTLFGLLYRLMNCGDLGLQEERIFILTEKNIFSKIQFHEKTLYKLNYIYLSVIFIKIWTIIFFFHLVIELTRRG